MVLLAESSPSYRSTRSLQIKKATVMLDYFLAQNSKAFGRA